mgnify:CR=1 FL=1
MERIVDPSLDDENSGSNGGSFESRQEEQLRPNTLSSYLGQEKVKQQMALFIGAARQRGEALDHTLIFGPPGLGLLRFFRLVGLTPCFGLFRTKVFT